MKRSEINNAIKFAQELLKKHSITLPFFANLPPKKEEFHRPEREAILKTMLGWDVSDFGSGDFEKCGAVLFTVRNGLISDSNIGTPYAEKYILLKDGNEQEIPMHYHITKTEDIINRAGGTMIIQVYAKGEDGAPCKTSDVTLFCDGERRTVPAGSLIEVKNGDSVTLPPYVYHRFYTKTGTGDIVVGEVSKINDDNTDNIFASDSGNRFCEIIEDEPIYRLLVNEY